MYLRFLMSKTIVRVYKLVDPRSNEVFYIGCTKKLLSQRLREHMRKEKPSGRSSRSMQRWALINDLIASGMKPKIKLLKIGPAKLLRSEELRYYNLYKKMGFNLLQYPTMCYYHSKYY